MKRCLKCSSTFAQSDWNCPDCGFHPALDNGWLTFAPDLAQENDGFEKGAFQELIQLEAGHFWFVARNHLIIWALQTFFPSAKTFLEVGCGTAFVLQGIEQVMPMVELAGSEIFTEGLKFASNRLSNGTLFQMDARQIPFEAEFDVIGAFDVLEHIEQDEIVLNQMFQAVRPGGGILLTVPQHSWLWSQADVDAHHVRRYAQNELQRKVEKAGFQVLKTTSFVAILLPLMLLSRIRWRNQDEPYNYRSEFMINPWLNKSLLAALRLEHLAIRAGISFPLGGSRLIVAQKSI